MAGSQRDVFYSPKSTHSSARVARPLCAISGDHIAFTAPTEQEILRAMRGAMRQQESRGPDPRTRAGLDRLPMALARR
jgi:hypothetical protein